MDQKLLEQLIAQQVYLLKRIEKLEYRVNGGFRMAPDQSYLDELIDKSKEIEIKIPK